MAFVAMEVIYSSEEGDKDGLSKSLAVLTAVSPMLTKLNNNDGEQAAL